MNIAQATTSGTRIGRGSGSHLAVGLFECDTDNDISGTEGGMTASATGFIYPFSGMKMTFAITRRYRLATLSVPVALGACTNTPTIVQNTATTVAVRYDGIANDIDDAKQVAEKACAARGKTARLNRVSNQGLGQRYGYFDCVSTTGLD